MSRSGGVTGTEADTEERWMAINRERGAPGVHAGRRGKGGGCGEAYWFPKKPRL